MPLYEYVCADCQTKFEALRSMSQADSPIACQRCNSLQTSRVFSTFAALSRSNSGQTKAVAGTGGGCANCASHRCSTCSHH